MSSVTWTVDNHVLQYLQSISLRETDVQRRLRQETAGIPMAVMQISPEQGQFMALLCKLMGARRTLELGVFTGYSTLCVAMTLPADGQVVACDVSEEWTSMGRRYWKEAGVADRIDLRLQPGVQTLDSLLAAGEAGSYDFAFIDADKPNYDNYYERCLKLLRKGGLIAFDNVLWSGKVADPKENDQDTVALRNLNQKLHTDSRVDISMLPIGDGLTLALKK